LGVALAVCPGQMRQSLPGTRCLRQYSYGSQSPEQCTLGERRSPRSVHVPADVPDIFLMVTRAGARRRSLRRPIADATSMTPKAACNCDALGDHQRSRKCGVDWRGAPGLAGRAWTRGARLDSRGALGLAGRGATPLRRVSDSHYRRCSYTGWLSLNVVKPNALTPLCPAGRGVNVRTGPLAIHCAAEPTVDGLNMATRSSVEV